MSTVRLWRAAVRRAWLLLIVSGALVVLSSVGWAQSGPAHANAQTAACATPLDVVLVLDSSASLSDGDLAQLRAAAHEFVRALLPASDSAARVGVVDFEVTVRSVLPLMDYSGVTAITNAIDGVGAPDRSYTNTGAGLRAALALYEPSGAQRVVVIITDGIPQLPEGSTIDPIADAIAAAAELRSAGVTSYVVGVESGGIEGGINPAVLEQLASAPVAQHLVQIGDYSGVLAALQAVAGGLCAPDIELTNERTSPPEIVVGDTGTFDITTTNSGDTPLTTVELSISWPSSPLAYSGIEGIDAAGCSEPVADAADSSLTTISCSLPDLDVGAGTPLELSLQGTAIAANLPVCANVGAVATTSRAAVVAGPACATISVVGDPTPRSTTPAPPTSPTPPTPPASPPIPAPAPPDSAVPPVAAGPPPAGPVVPSSPTAPPAATTPGTPALPDAPPSLSPPVTIPGDPTAPPAQVGPPAEPPVEAGPPPSVAQPGAPASPFAPPNQVQPPAQITPPDSGHGYLVGLGGGATLPTLPLSIALGLASLGLVAVGRRFTDGGRSL